MMTKIYPVAAVVSLLLSGSANAFDATVDVVSVTPVKEIVNQPYESCGTEYEQQSVTTPRSQTAREVGGGLLGGIAGGLLGSLMGEGNGKVAAAAVGAGVGAIAGGQLAKDRSATGETRSTMTPVNRCKMVDHWDVKTNYNVVYEYNGQRFTTKLPYDPGRQMKVNVSVTPK